MWNRFKPVHAFTVIEVPSELQICIQVINIDRHHCHPGNPGQATVKAQHTHYITSGPYESLQGSLQKPWCMSSCFGM